jgi:uncharacterized Zn-binding protein involved in type VI secretion
MPACTITSQTAHGGVVMVGFPQVLIGMMPASRIGDMHVCPMVTGIVPHVGGPFILGSMTVLVGMMPQSRVTDQLVCVGPPDVAAMGCETVLVGMSGAGGAAGAVAGIAAMGASVPAAPPATSTSPQPTAELQQNGTVKTSAPPDGHLPPATLSSPGFPDLPGKAAQNFQTAQPVDIPPGTTLYRVYDPTLNSAGCYWTPDVFPSEAAWRQACAVRPEWPNSALLVAVGVVQAPGLKAWMGAAARQGDLDGGGTQVWMPEGALPPGAVFQSSWAAASQQEQAAQQAVLAAQAAANNAQQAAAQGADAAQQAAELAAQGAAEAAQQAVEQARQAAQQAVQQAQQAQQAAKQAAQGAKLASEQAQKAAQQAGQSAQQAQQSAQQAEQSVQQGLPKGIV